MQNIVFFVLILSIISQIKCKTLYEYYKNGNITSGLRGDSNGFYLNGNPITIFSGSFHYFRAHPKYWRPILQKMKAVGLNAVDFYSPWNLHEQTPGDFDFESEFLNITGFLEAIRETDMFAVFRPGPYICAEFDFGGLPSWLLRDNKMKIRSNYEPYLNAVDNYWKSLFEITKHFQFSLNGGPIIAIQIENEFGSYGDTNETDDAIYMRKLGQIAYKYGMRELFFTSDGPWQKNRGSLDIYLRALNFNKDGLKNLQAHKLSHPSQPLLVGEYWSGWFNNWGGYHNIQNVSYFSQQFQQIVFQMNSSLNIYMFFGGTNYGFTAGNVAKALPRAVSSSVITSYDYDAPLSESGNYTQKYWKIKELIEKFNTERHIPKVNTINPPVPNRAISYGVINVMEQLSLNNLLNRLTAFESKYVISMENINIGPNYGQNFGFTLYRNSIKKYSKTIQFTQGRVNDRAAVVVNDKQIDFIYANNKGFNVSIPETVFGINKQNDSYLDILVENLGRVFYGSTLNDMNIQRKGLNEEILIDGQILLNWKLYSLDFKQQFMEQLRDYIWEPITQYRSPTFYKASLNIEGTPYDTYLKLNNWITSVVFVNGFNIGRYWNVGPAKTLYVAAPLLKKGINEIIIFETQGMGTSLEFTDKPILGPIFDSRKLK